MVDAISSATRTDPNQDIDPNRNTEPATRVVVPPPPPPDLPDVTAFIQNAVRAATGRLAAPSPAPHPMLAMGVRVEEVDTRVLTPMQSNIDAFRDRATPTFHTPDAGPDGVSVHIPFRMALTPKFMARHDPAAQPYIDQELVARGNAGELSAVARGLGLSAPEIKDLASGRGTPENIQRVTQTLIDQGKLPPGLPSDVGPRIRSMMCNYGIGLDCAGYVQQAFLASRGISRSQTSLRPASDENLSGLGARGFKSVPLGQARAGDLFIMRPPRGEDVGHTTIIRDSRMATPEEAAALPRQNGAWGHPSASTLQRLELDSSWGNGANAQAGGAMRQVFWHDSASDKWLHQAGNAWIVESTPYFSHPIDGIYRPAQEK